MASTDVLHVTYGDELADGVRTHGIDGRDLLVVRDELADVWDTVAHYAGNVLIHVDERPCVDCATFVACALDALHRAGRGIARSNTGVSIVRGSNPADAVALGPADIAAGAGAWHLLLQGDAAGLTLAATDLEVRGGMVGFPELPALLVRRARGDVQLAEVHP